MQIAFISIPVNDTWRCGKWDHRRKKNVWMERRKMKCLHFITQMPLDGWNCVLTRSCRFSRRKFLRRRLESPRFLLRHGALSLKSFWMTWETRSRCLIETRSRLEIKGEISVLEYVFNHVKELMLICQLLNVIFNVCSSSVPLFPLIYRLPVPCLCSKCFLKEISGIRRLSDV